MWVIYLMMLAALCVPIYRAYRLVQKKGCIGDMVYLVKISIIDSLFLSGFLPLTYAGKEIYDVFHKNYWGHFGYLASVLWVIIAFSGFYTSLLMCKHGFYDNGIICGRGIYTWDYIKSAKIEGNTCILEIQDNDRVLKVKFKKIELIEDIKKLLEEKKLLNEGEQS